MTELPIPDPISITIPSEISKLLDEAQERRESILEEHRSPLLGYVPGDFNLIYQGLAFLKKTYSPSDLFCEWGCGIGIVVALAEKLGFDSHGIEIQDYLIDEGREFFEAKNISAELYKGSFIPEDFDGYDLVEITERVTVLDGSNALDEVEHTIDEFDLIYAFPWPGEEELYFNLFEERAQPGALLLTYHGPTEGLKLHRKE